MALGAAALGREMRPIREAVSPPAVRRRDSVFRRLLAVADAGSACLAVVVCVVLLGEDHLRPATLAVLPLVVLVSKAIGLYDRDELTLRKSTLEEVPALFQLATLYALVVWLLEGRLISGTLGHDQVLGLWAALFGSLVLGRALARRLARRLTPAERCVVIGDQEVCARVAAKLAGSTHTKAELVASLPLDQPAGDWGGRLDQLGGSEPLRAFVEALDVQRLIVAPGSTDSESVLDVTRMAKAAGLKVSIVPRIFEVVGSSVEFDDLDGITVLGVRRFGLTRTSRLLKRGFDICGALVMALVLSPPLALIALAVRLESRGPALFRQARVGRGGRSFEMLKFRTMIDGADGLKAGLRRRNEAQGLFKIAEDPRLTRVGRFLRRASLDELPQLANVLRGEMSLVGPRPLVAEEDQQVVGWSRRRLLLTPGMTGQWQILGSARIPLQEMVTIDYLYVANWSLWGDVKILVRTVPYMLARRGM